MSPLAGALLDRHGRKRLIIVDYVVALLTIGSIGLLALLHLLPVWLLLVMSVVSSMTVPLGNTGMRTLSAIRWWVGSLTGTLLLAAGLSLAGAVIPLVAIPKTGDWETPAAR